MLGYPLSGREPLLPRFAPSNLANVRQTACGEGDLIFSTADWPREGAEYGLSLIHISEPTRL
ncbi:MAG TPA: hypothetical protein DDW26_02150, partial [Rhizobiales bacterium]|nr:hypothetical protein [Hyphomicrobiales bacterium]